jgi:hypothetical protein
MPVVCVSHVCIVSQSAIRFIARSSALFTSACDIVCHAGSAVLCGIRISARSPFTTPSIYFCCARVCSPFRYRCEHCLLPQPAPFLSSIPSAACLNAVSQSIIAPHLPHASSLARFWRKLSRIAGEMPEPPPLVPTFGLPRPIRGPSRCTTSASCGIASPPQGSIAVSLSLPVLCWAYGHVSFEKKHAPPSALADVHQMCLRATTLLCGLLHASPRAHCVRAAHPLWGGALATRIHAGEAYLAFSVQLA